MTTVAESQKDLFGEIADVPAPERVEAAQALLDECQRVRWLYDQNSEGWTKQSIGYRLETAFTELQTILQDSAIRDHLVVVDGECVQAEKLGYTVPELRKAMGR